MTVIEQRIAFPHMLAQRYPERSPERAYYLGLAEGLMNAYRASGQISKETGKKWEEKIWKFLDLDLSHVLTKEDRERERKIVASWKE